MRSTSIAVPILVVLAATAACSSSAKPAAVQTPAPTAATSVTETSAAIPAAPVTTATADDVLTGFGATPDAWQAHHTVDLEDGPGAGLYNLDPDLPNGKDGKTGHDYTTVTATSGHVDAYFLNFTARTVAAALARVKLELPADASLSSPVAASGDGGLKCLVLTATSAAVGKALGGAQGSSVFVELRSATTTDLDQSAIVWAALVSANDGSNSGC